MATKKNSADESRPTATKANEKNTPPRTSSPLASVSSSSGCCSGTRSCSSTTSVKTPGANKNDHTSDSLFTQTKQDSTKGSKTRIVVKYDVGFNNHLFIRGKGANLTWDKGIQLKNIKTDEWIWESEIPFNAGEFKVLINDRLYEIGENRPLHFGKTLQYTPKF